MAACLPALAWASTRSQAQMIPSSSSSEASSSPAVSSRKEPSAAQPGAASSGLPEAKPAAGPAYSPGNDSADPGIPGPRRPVTTAAIAAVCPNRAQAAAAPA
jgi:hypothetical protein